MKYSCLTYSIVIKGPGYSVKDQALNGCLLLCMFFADDFCGHFVYSASHHQLNKAVFWCHRVYVWGFMKFCRLKKVFIYFDMMGTTGLYNRIHWVVSRLLCTSHLTGACLFQLVTQNKPYLRELLHLS